MLKKTITYTDYDGNERTEDFYFNLSEAEVTKMEMGTPGGLTKTMQRVIAEQDSRRIIEIFDDLILRSYGVKSLDGKTFVKNAEVTAAFAQTEAYSKIFMELATNPEKATEFFNGVIPQTINGKPVARVTTEAALQAAGLPSADAQ